jgi:HEAT repeat protein
LYQDIMEDAHKRHRSPRSRFDNAENEKSSLEALIKDALENESIEKREEAVIALGESRNKNAIAVISKVLMNDPNEEVRLSSVDALLAIGNASVIQPLSVGLRDQKPSVRESAVEALAAIGGEPAKEMIKSAMNDEDESVRVLAQGILEEMDSEND